MAVHNASGTFPPRQPGDSSSRPLRAAPRAGLLRALFAMTKTEVFANEHARLKPGSCASIVWIRGDLNDAPEALRLGAGCIERPGRVCRIASLGLYALRLGHRFVFPLTRRLARLSGSAT
jgi:hypothetical protein